MLDFNNSRVRKNGVIFIWEFVKLHFNQLQQSGIK